MLKDIRKRRPDRKLERNLLLLAYTVMLMSLSFFSLFVYPQYLIYIIITAVVLNIFAILITIRIMKVSETAIGFGALAGEIISDESKYQRVDNMNGEIVIANKSAINYFGEQNIGNYFSQNIIKTDANKLDLQKLYSSIKNLQPAIVELSVNPRENSVFVTEEWFRVSVKPIYLNKTDIFEGKYSLKRIQKETYLYWVIENITAYKNMEQVFKTERSEREDFVDSLPVGLYVTDLGGTIEYMNSTLSECLKLKKNEALGRKISDFIVNTADEFGEADKDFFGTAQLKIMGKTLDVFVTHKTMIRDGIKKIRGVIAWNLPSDSDLLSSLNKMKDSFERLFDTMPIGVVFADKKQKIIDVNHNAEIIFNKEKKDFVQFKLANCFSKGAEKSFKDVVASYAKNDGKVFNFETTYEDKKLHIQINPLIYSHSENSDDIEGMIVFARDISNESNLEQQVSQAQKMQAFGQMAGEVAHDFNNLLTAIIGYCDLLIQRHGVGDPSFSDLMQVKQNANRAAGLARQMLAISRKQPLNPKLINVAEAFMETEHLLSRFVGEQIKMKINCASGIGCIRFDPVQFSQVMINLAINARDAMEGKGILTITSRSEHLSEPYRFGDFMVQSGDFVVISVSDTGCGISEENLNRIFEPFFTTKKHSATSGTGLGLAVVYNIVHQTGGFIKVNSELGKGTTFEIYLPEFADEIKEQEVVSQDENIIRNKDGNAVLTMVPPVNSADEKPILGMNIFEFDSRRSFALNPENTHILFVDDEDAVRSVGARGLKRKGFEVTDCISAENALEHINNGEKFDMLITDMMMPGMSGADLAKEIHAKLPEIKIILASGYSEEIARKELAGSQDFYFMSKPYSLDDLTKKVMEVLNKNE